jgi:hypothetical protein
MEETKIKLPSRFQIGDEVLVYNRIETKIRSILFTESKVYYHVEGRIGRIDSLDVYPMPNTEE